ncbi:MAG TPA: ARMT1-like domain-containing protein [Phycisphaerae bacterium]|nr:ARMT1-like domain-containing protein [Phycisphaerae bacterium]
MPVFKLLNNPAKYYPCTQDMLLDEQFREYWLKHFVTHFDLTSQLAQQVYGPSIVPAVARAKKMLSDEMEKLRRQPDVYGELNLQVLGLIRQKCLKENGIDDPFILAKQRENDASLTLYPEVISQMDSINNRTEALRLLVEGVFAGNIFDLGATATAGIFASQSPDFLKIRAGLDGKRPWLIDQFDVLADNLIRRGTYRKVLIFVDNAGSDFVLGIAPLARWLAICGSTVCLLANQTPSLNDMTVDETRALLPRIAQRDTALAKLLVENKITVASSGGTTPLLDLRDVSDECNQEAAGADLLIFEGMGRGLESNFNALFTVDAVKLCMIKEPIIAQRHGGKVFDVVFRYDPAAEN